MAPSARLPELRSACSGLRLVPVSVDKLNPPQIDLIYALRCGILIVSTPCGVDTAESSVVATRFVDSLTTEIC